MITADDPIDLDALRIRHEFLTLPDLHASSAAIAARVDVSVRHAEQILNGLVSEGFLERAADGQYARPTGASSNRPPSRANV